MRFFGFAFLIYLAAELGSIIFMVQEIGGLATMLWIVATFFLGSYMLKNSGIANVLMMGGLWKNRTLSFYQTMWPIRFTVAALLFMVPGLISDFMAVLLILPFKGPKTAQNSPYSFSQENDTQYQQNSSYESQNKNYSVEDVVEGEYREIDPKN